MPKAWKTRKRSQPAATTSNRPAAQKTRQSAGFCFLSALKIFQMTSKHDDTQAAPHRGRAMVIIGFAMTAALMLNALMLCATERHDHRKAALAQELKQRRCVVADFDRRSVSVYKCELPNANTYVPAEELYAEALAKYPGK